MLFIIVAILTVFFCACNKEHGTIVPKTPDAGDGNFVTITFANAEDTRAFFETTAKAEVFESKINTLSIFAFDNAGKLLIRRDFTNAEITSKSATFALPKSAANTECIFYAVVNFDASSATTRPALLALLETSPTDYNGTFAELSTKAKRPGGFVMSGSATKTVGAANSTTPVAITIHRTVAKIALQTTIDPSFAAKYPGRLTINSVKLSRAASQSLLITASVPNTGAMSYNYTQTPSAESGKFNSLFYCFETKQLTSGNRVLLEIYATYDIDGNTSTTDDLTDVTYSVELDGNTTGQILRNGYYRVSANITGLVGQECQIAITVSDWETPVSQQVDLGA